MDENEDARTVRLILRKNDLLVVNDRALTIRHVLNQMKCGYGTYLKRGPGSQFVQLLETDEASQGCK